MGAEAVKDIRACLSRENRAVQNLTKPDYFSDLPYMDYQDKAPNVHA